MVCGCNYVYMYICILNKLSDETRSIASICRLIKNDTGRAILRVISGPKAFRVVLFTRLTPIPFGVQNVIFGVSD